MLESLQSNTLSELFWRAKIWPRGNSRHVFLAVALDQVGRRLHGEGWTGEETIEGCSYNPFALSAAANFKPPRRRPPPPPISLSVYGSSAWDRQHVLRMLDMERRKQADAHVQLWRERKRADAAVAEFARRRDSWERLQSAMDWIAERGCEEGQLITRGRFVGGGDFFDLEPWVWNVESLWSTRFEQCQFKFRGLNTYLFFTRDSLDQCLSGLPKPRKPGKYDAQDLPMVNKMRELIESGQESGPNPASLLFADQAEGGGSSTSKAKRLERLYIATYGKA